MLISSGQSASRTLSHSPTCSTPEIIGPAVLPWPEADPEIQTEDALVGSSNMTLQGGFGTSKTKAEGVRSVWDSERATSLAFINFVFVGGLGFKHSLPPFHFPVHN